MKNKYYEYIIIYLSVAIGCFAISLIVRATAVAQGVDTFSANTIFWLIAGLGIVFYCVPTVVITRFRLKEQEAERLRRETENLGLNK